MRKIVIYPSEILRKKAIKVEKVNAELLEEMKDLSLILTEKDIGAGLAAPQIGVLKRFFGLKDMDTKKVSVFINPKITSTFGRESSFIVMIDDDGKKHDFLDGCLSIPNFYGTDKRFLKIEAQWQAIKDDKLIDKKAVFEGFDAIVFQHELDHLDGILFTDRVKADGGKFYKQAENGDLIPWSIDKVVEQEKKVFQK